MLAIEKSKDCPLGLEPEPLVGSRSLKIILNVQSIADSFSQQVESLSICTVHERATPAALAVVENSVPPAFWPQLHSL